jgi:hypothetical protein
VEIEVCEDWVGFGKVFHEASKIDQRLKERSHAQKSASTYLVPEANSSSPSRSSAAV